jgi:hypothetical protein
MLKEVQTPPALGLGVVDPAAERLALRAREPSAPFELDPQLKPALATIEGGPDHLPRRA